MLVVDPMHNLFLVSAKHLLKKVWSANDVLVFSKRKPVNIIYKVLWIAASSELDKFLVKLRLDSQV